MHSSTHKHHHGTSRTRSLRVLQSVPAGTLLPFEYRLAEDAWAKITQGTRNFLSTADDLAGLMRLVNIPITPSMNSLAAHFLASKQENRFNFSDFTDYLQRCKTLHTKYRRKVVGYQFDDELLEAYVAVGGNRDTTGVVDVGAIRGVIDAFSLHLYMEGEAPFPASSAQQSSANAALLNGSGDSSPNASMVNSPTAHRAPAPESENARLPFKAFMNLLKRGEGDDDLVPPDTSNPTSLNGSFTGMAVAGHPSRPPPALVAREPPANELDLDDLFRDDLNDFMTNDDMFGRSVTESDHATPGHAALTLKGKRRSFNSWEGLGAAEKPGSRGAPGVAAQQKPTSGVKLAPLDQTPSGATTTATATATSSTTAQRGRSPGSKSPARGVGSLRRKQLPPLSTSPDPKGKKHKFAT